jgi:hypothetical protein
LLNIRQTSKGDTHGSMGAHAIAQCVPTPVHRHTHTHTHTQGERERVRERGKRGVKETEEERCGVRETGERDTERHLLQPRATAQAMSTSNGPRGAGGSRRRKGKRRAVYTTLVSHVLRCCTTQVRVTASVRALRCE